MLILAYPWLLTLLPLPWLIRLLLPPRREEPSALRVLFGDRLSAVKEVLGDFPGKRQGDRVGLVVFGDAPYGQGKRLPD